MSAGRGEDAERFAAAVEQGTPPGSPGDAELSRELEIVAMLRSHGATYAPAPGAKARAKQRLLAALDEPSAQELTTPMGPVGAPLGAPVSVPAAEDTAVTARIEPITDPPAGAEPAAGTERLLEPAVPATRTGRRAGRHQMPSRPSGRSGESRTPGRGGLRRRAAAVTSAAMVLMVALAGAGFFASRDALPGDTLYAVKRVSESTGLALTFDDEARAMRHLELATTRLNEVEQLLTRQQSATADAALVRSTIRDFDLATGEGSRMLLGDEELDGAAELDGLQVWAAEQSARLSGMRALLPAPALADADGSLALLERLIGRTEALEGRSTCSEVTTSTVDDLGPLPAAGDCEPRAEVPAEISTSDEAEQSTEEGGPSSTSEDGTGSEVTSSTAPPTTTPGAESEEQGGLLPELAPAPAPAPDRGRLSGPGSSTSGGGTTTTPDEAEPLQVPLPLRSPVTLQPLLPGMPGITIG